LFINRTIIYNFPFSTVKEYNYFLYGKSKHPFSTVEEHDGSAVNNYLPGK